MVIIKRIDPASAMKIGALLNALAFTVFGLLFLAMPGLMISSLSFSNSGISSSGFSGSSFMTLGLASLCLVYLIGVVFSAIAGAIGGAVAAFFYNVLANWVGGLQIELESVESTSRKTVTVGPVFRDDSD